MCHNKIINYTYPTLYTGKTWYIGFMALDPATKKMRRKRYKIEHIHGTKERRRYAAIMITRLMDKLDSGWNPWTSSEQGKEVSFDEVCRYYKRYIEHAKEDGTMRPDTVRSYKSNLNVFLEWIMTSGVSILTCQDISRKTCSQFLDHLYIERKLSVTTRNNYLVWMGTFFRWMMERQYIDSLPTEDIKALRKQKSKNRQTIPEKELARLRDYLNQNNKHYLLAVYLIYYMFVRPKEISMLRIDDFCLKDQILHIPDTVSKNRRHGNVTLPKKIIHLMLDLDVFSFPGDYYLFGDKFLPGKTYKSQKQFEDYWYYHIRRDLRWPETYKLYSLKDTGITRQLHNLDSLTVRDQARHSDLSITNIYAERSTTGNEQLKTWDDIL